MRVAVRDELPGCAVVQMAACDAQRVLASSQMQLVIGEKRLGVAVDGASFFKQGMIDVDP